MREPLRCRWLLPAPVQRSGPTPPVCGFSLQVGMEEDGLHPVDGVDVLKYPLKIGAHSSAG